MTLRPDVNPNRTKITRFVPPEPNMGPAMKAGKKENGRSWRGKRKRAPDDDGSELVDGSGTDPNSNPEEQEEAEEQQEEMEDRD